MKHLLIFLSLILSAAGLFAQTQTQAVTINSAGVVLNTNSTINFQGNVLEVASSPVATLGGNNTFSGTNNFSGALQLKGNNVNTTNGLVAADAYNAIPNNVRTANPDNMTLMVEGASISSGYHASGTNTTVQADSFGFLLSQLPFFANHLTTYTNTATISGGTSMVVTSTNGISLGQEVTGTGIPMGTLVSFYSNTNVTLSQTCSNETSEAVTFTNYINVAVGSAQTPAGYNGGQTVTGSGVAGSYTLSCTTSPSTTNPGPWVSVVSTNTNVPFAEAATISGTNLTLMLPLTGTVTSASLVLGGNNISDRFLPAIWPHRSTAFGGDGGTNPCLVLFGDTYQNDIANAGTSYPTILNSLSTYVTSNCNAYGITPMLGTAGSVLYNGSGTTWTLSNEVNRETIIDIIRGHQASGGVGGTYNVCDTSGKILTDPGNTMEGPLYYTDYTHLVLLGHQAVARYLNAVFTIGSDIQNATNRCIPEITQFTRPVSILTSALDGTTTEFSDGSTGAWSIARSGAASFGAITSTGNMQANSGDFLIRTSGYYIGWWGSSSYDTSINRLGAGSLGIGTATSGGTNNGSLSAGQLITTATPSSGSIGFTTNSLVTSTNSISLSTGSTSNVCSVAVSAGRWKVDFQANISLTTNTMIASSPMEAGINTSSATLPAANLTGYLPLAITLGSSTVSVPLASNYITTTTNTTIYGVEQATFSAGSASGFGTLTAVQQP